jgi:hypothetical protein
MIILEGEHFAGMGLPQSLRSGFSQEDRDRPNNSKWDFRIQNLSCPQATRSPCHRYI